MIAVTSTVFKGGEEVWRPVVGFEGYYEVSNQGHVKRVKRGKGAVNLGHNLSPNKNPGGYLTVYLSKDTKRSAKMVHLLVAQAFIGPANGREVNHKDGIKVNCFLENLEYTTRRGNADHAKAHGLYHRGTQLKAAALNEEIVLQVRRLSARGLTNRDICKKFGVTPSCIHGIISGRTWAWL